jgi:hypothetical protein
MMRAKTEDDHPVGPKKATVVIVGGNAVEETTSTFSFLSYLSALKTPRATQEHQDPSPNEIRRLANIRND